MLHNRDKILLTKPEQFFQEHFFEKSLAGQRVLQGLLVFSSEEEAERATNLTGTVIGDRHVIVSKFRQFVKPTSKMVEVSNLSVGKSN